MSVVICIAVYLIVGIISCIIWNKFVPDMQKCDQDGLVVAMMILYPMIITMYGVTKLFDYIKKVGQ